MMIAIFRQPRADIDVKLERIYFRPGEIVEAAVTVLPSESFTLRHCSVDLACVETYYMDHSEGPPSEHKRDLERITKPLLANVEVLKGESIGGVVQFEVPHDAVQSIFGEAARRPCLARAARLKAGWNCRPVRDFLCMTFACSWSAPNGPWTRS